LWDHAQIAEGLRLVESALVDPGASGILRGAGCDRGVACGVAPSYSRQPTGRRSAGLYEVLLRIAPSPVGRAQSWPPWFQWWPARRVRWRWSTRLRRAAGSTAMNCLPRGPRRSVGRRLGRHDGAREAYREATAATQLGPLRRLYARRLGGDGWCGRFENVMRGGLSSLLPLWEKVARMRAQRVRDG